VPEDAEHPTSGRGAQGWMATRATIKGPVSLDAQKISLVRIRSVDCECEGGGSYEALRRLSEGTLTACSLTAKTGQCSRVHAPPEAAERAMGKTASGSAAMRFSSEDWEPEKIERGAYLALT
jgi:hypothetical protein